MVVIFGAGASKATQQLPIDADFLFMQKEDALKDLFLGLALDKIFGTSNWVNESLENAWSEIDDNYNLPKVVLTTEEIKKVLQEFENRAASEEKLGEYPRYYSTYFHTTTPRTPHNWLFLFAGWELRKLMLRVLNVRAQSKSLGPYNKLFESARREDESFKVVSFNYDTLAEQALRSYRYYPFKESDEHEVLKPHGSLNWRHTFPADRPDSIDVVNSLSVDELGFDETNCLVQHSIIGLTRAKREFGPLEESSAIRFYYPRILDRSAALLASAASLYIIGYSFPLADAHLRTILNKARRQRQGQEPYKRIVYVIKDNETKNKPLYKSRIARLFGTPEDRVEVLMNGFDNVDWQAVDRG